MNIRSLATLAFTVLTLAIGTTAIAQQGNFQTQPTVQVQTAPNPYYFGLHGQLTHGYFGPELQIVSVTPGGPACRAGLEVGDVIKLVNGNRFRNVFDSYQAVAQMNQFVRVVSRNPAPAAPAAAAGFAVTPNVATPIASMIVKNVRNGQDVHVTVYPQRRAFPNPGPAPAAPANAGGVR